MCSTMSRFELLGLDDDATRGDATGGDAARGDFGEHEPEKLEAPPPSPPSKPNLGSSPLFWVDLEFTGLSAAIDHILEVAMIVSDGNLETLIEGPDLVIHQSDGVLSSMNEWSMKQHGESGLTERCRTAKTSLADAETALVEFVALHCPQGMRATLAGACVYKDKEFLEAHMPRLRDLLNHRVVDVSTVRELGWRWNRPVMRSIPKPDSACAHRALDDIRYSIEELRHFRDHLFASAVRTPGDRTARGGRGGRGGRGKNSQRRLAESNEQRGHIAALTSDCSASKFVATLDSGVYRQAATEGSDSS